MMGTADRLVSVVIPVYNGEKYIGSAIRSVIGQTYQHWELTVVDDGSSDGTAGICESLAGTDSRISVFHKENGGVNSARAMGVENSSGQCLMFLDADDTLPPDALEKSMASMEPSVRILATGREDRFMNRGEYIERLLKGDVGPELWGKLFDMDLFRTVDFHLERRMAMGEDLLLNLVLALNVDEAKVTSTRFYAPNSSNNASVTRTFKKTWEYEKYFFKRMEELFVDKCKDFSNYDEIVYLVNKSRLNGMKYLMLDGNSIDWADSEYFELKKYFKNPQHRLGPSERLIFRLENASLYRMVMRTVMRLVKRFGNDS